MTKNIEIHPKMYVDLDLLKKQPGPYLKGLANELSNNRCNDYTLEQVKGLEVFADIAYQSLPESKLPAFMNERIYIWASLTDLKEKLGIEYVPASDLEPITKKPRK